MGRHLESTTPRQACLLKSSRRCAERQAFWTDEERGYSAIQGSKPQTIGYVLNDSPVGLAAWIVEKFRAWSDVDGDVESKFTKDELLTNITVYWVTQTATSAARLYYELRHPPAGSTSAAAVRLEVPTGCAAFPKEDLVHPSALAGGTLQPHAFHDHAARRTLRRSRGA